MKLIDKILGGSYVDLDTGRNINLPIKDIKIGCGLISNPLTLLEQLDLGNNLLIVSDENTQQERLQILKIILFATVNRSYSKLVLKVCSC